LEAKLFTLFMSRGIACSLRFAFNRAILRILLRRLEGEPA